MSIDKKQLLNWNNSFNSDINNKLMQNIISDNALRNLSTNRETSQKYQPLFSNKVSPIIKATDQKSSGRCWLFAALNVIRRQIIKKYNIKDFEFSQNYLFFWDKLERFNYNLECIIETKTEKLNSKIVQHILDDPTCDGGQWEMAVNLIEKYGLVPKSVYNESYHSSNSSEINSVLTKLFIKNAKILREADDSNLKQLKNEMMKHVYNILCKFLGTPPDFFDWHYQKSDEEKSDKDKSDKDKSDKDNSDNTDNSDKDKSDKDKSDKDKSDKDKSDNTDKSIITIKNLTPLLFYKEYVDFNCHDYVCLINDPRKEHKYNSIYTVKFLGNVFEGRPVKYLNLDIKNLKNIVLQNIKNNTPVWFGCDVDQQFHAKSCAMDFNLTNKLELFNIDFSLSKEDRLNYKDSLMTHAMVITGANIEKNVSSISNNENENVNIWQIENSWSDKGPTQGYYTMTDKWFDEYVFEIVVHKKYLTEEQNKLYNTSVKNHITLEPWDPMGSLA